MERAQITEAVTKRLIENLGCKPEAITEDATIESLGADSLDGVELVMQMEEDFSVEISDSEGDKIVTVADAINLVERKVNG